MENLQESPLLAGVPAVLLGTDFGLSPAIYGDKGGNVPKLPYASCQHLGQSRLVPSTWW